MLLLRLNVKSLDNTLAVRLTGELYCSYSAFAPDSAITFFHLMRSTSISAAISSGVLVLGIIPPEIVPSAIKSSMSCRDKPVSNFSCLSSMPAVLVNKLSFSAFNASASLPATRSALLL